MVTREMWWRLLDIFWQLSELCKSLLPGEFARLYRVVRPYTLCSSARLRGLYCAVQYAVARSIPGEVVECGTARGGSTALMGLTLKQLGCVHIHDC